MTITRTGAALLIAVLATIGLAPIEPAAAAPRPSIDGFTLLDATTGRALASFDPGDEVLLPRGVFPAGLNLRAETTGADRVEFFLAGAGTTDDEAEPYTLAPGDKGARATAPFVSPGRNLVRARAVTGDGVPSFIAEVVIDFVETDLTVNTTRDEHDADLYDGRCRTASGACSLRAAVEQGQAYRGFTTIGLDGGLGTFELSEGSLIIERGIGIVGHDRPVIDGRNRHRIFSVQTGVLELDGVRLRNGSAPSTGRGGAIRLAERTRLELRNSSVYSSRANIGGGIYAQRATTIIEGSWLGSNQAGDVHDRSGDIGGLTQRGGALAILGGTASLDGVEVMGNKAVRGGGIWMVDAVLDIHNSSFAWNEALEEAGAIQTDGELTVTYSTIVANKAGTNAGSPIDERVGGGLHVRGGDVRLAATILAANEAGVGPSSRHYAPDCWSPERPIRLHGANVIGIADLDICLWDDRGERSGSSAVGSSFDPVDPRLLPPPFAVRNELPIDADSPAVDRADAGAGGLASCPAVDIIGQRRPSGDGCDAGSFEYQTIGDRFDIDRDQDLVPRDLDLGVDGIERLRGGFGR